MASRLLNLKACLTFNLALTTLLMSFLEDGTLLNAKIIKNGYGHALTRYPFSRMEKFRRLERDARAQRRGFWGKK